MGNTLTGEQAIKALRKPGVNLCIQTPFSEYGSASYFDLNVKKFLKRLKWHDVIEIEIEIGDDPNIVWLQKLKMAYKKAQV